MPAPLVYMLCGLTGSGKTVCAERLEAEGRMRLSIDEFVQDRHDRYDIDYPAHEYPRLYEEAVREVDRQLVELLQQASRRCLTTDCGRGQPRALQAVGGSLAATAAPLLLQG